MPINSGSVIIRNSERSILDVFWKKEGNEDGCRTAEGMVSSYIKHDLPLNELEEFLDHVQNCSSCYDELETYFIVHEVTQQLDDDSSDSVLDFKKLLEQDIRKSRRYIRKKKASWLMFGVSICLLIATIAAILIFVMMETNYIL
mgnify:CR=1 FL=1